MDVSTLKQQERASHAAPPPPETLGQSHGARATSVDRRSLASRWWLFNFVVPLGILLAGAGAVLLLGEKSALTRPPDDLSLAARLSRIPEVQTLPVRSLEAAGGRLDLRVDGEVVPYREVQIATEVAGRIIYKDPACEVGSFVQKGQLLIRIDPTDYQSEIDRLAKQKEQEYQAIRELEQEIVNSNRLLQVAEQEIELRERDVKRLQSLPAGIASQTELDQAQRARLQSLNARITLSNQLDLMRQRRARLQAAEELAGIQLQMAKTNLERAEIRSPISGVIYREDAELNSFVQRGAVIVTIEDVSKAEVVVNLRSDQLFWVLEQSRNQPDQPPSSSSSAEGAPSYRLPETQITIEYQVAGREDEVYRWYGHLERYDGIGFDTTSRTVPVRIMVDHPRRYDVAARDASESDPRDHSAIPSGPSALVRGMFVTAVLHVVPKRPLVVLPGVALRPGHRIWKFIEDPSVLEPPADAPTDADPQATAESSSAEASPPSADASLIDDPKNWVVGRLEVLEKVRPIESVQLTEAQEKVQPSDAQRVWDADGEATYWVAEVGGGSLVPGDRVIVSPLPSFEGGGNDRVRVQRDQIHSPNVP